MGKLESIRITECPAALLSFAQKHNALVDMLAAMTGTGDVTVTVAEQNIIIGAASGASMESRVATLEALLSGYVDTEAELCPSGTVTVLAKV